jgi:hypothetical protein
MALYMQSGRLVHPNRADQVDKQMKLIRTAKETLNKIEAAGCSNLSLDVSLRAPDEYLAKLAGHLQYQLRRHEGINHFRQRNLRALEAEAVKDEATARKLDQPSEDHVSAPRAALKLR